MEELPPPPSEPQGLQSSPSTTKTRGIEASPTAPRRGRRWPIALIIVGAVIVIIAAAFATTNVSSDTTSPSSAAPSPTPPPELPSNVRAAAGAFQVKLTWHTASEGTPPTRYDIRRNGDFLGQAKGSATSFVDSDAVPGTRYRYTVTAVGTDDQQQGAAAVSVTTKIAPPGTAALVGTFNVHLHNTANSGFGSFGKTDFNNGWRFQPTCKEPPCNTQLRNIQSKKMIVLLKQSGGSYKGSAPVTGLVTCQGHDVTTNVTITIHATQADAVQDSWTITKFTGTMSQYASAQLGCTSSSASFTVTGTSLKH